jgi:hypothetical protein
MEPDLINFSFPNTGRVGGYEIPVNDKDSSVRIKINVLTKNLGKPTHEKLAASTQGFCKRSGVHQVRRNQIRQHFEEDGKSVACNTMAELGLKLLLHVRDLST